MMCPSSRSGGNVSVEESGGDMKQDQCEFDALIGAQGPLYRWGVWARSRRRIARSMLDLGSIGLAAALVAICAVAFPMLILSTERDLVRLIQF